MRKLYFFSLAAAILMMAGLGGCNIINPTEPVPTYFRVDSFSFDNINPRGSTSRNITHIWAYVDNQAIGIFDLPATFPAVLTKRSTVTILPGIDYDGLRGYAVTYPMYASDTMQLDPRPGETVNWTPGTYYLEGSLLPYEETFDQPVRLKFGYRSGSSSLERATDDTREGAGAGIIRLDQTQDSLTVLSDSMALTIGRAAYVELDFKGDMPLTVGMRSYLNTGGYFDRYLITLRPQDNWKKFYVGIREFVAEWQGSRYQIILGTGRNAGQSSGTVRIDNVKVVSF